MAFAADPFAATLRGVLGPVTLIGVFAAPLAWLLALLSIRWRLPHAFAVLSRWFVGIHAAAGALVLYGLIEGVAIGQPLRENLWGWIFLAVAQSGAGCWIFVGRRSRRDETPASLT